MAGVEEIKVPASRGNLNRLIDFIVGFAERHGFDHQRTWELELVADEVFMNIIDYAYPQQKGDIEVKCLYDQHRGLSMEITDNGIPFNPLAYSDSDIGAVKKNGFGIVLIRRLIDKIDYERAGDSNRLTLTKRSCVLTQGPEDSIGPAPIGP
jgi:serine/threonine-protein kinase RsbW